MRVQLENELVGRFIPDEMDILFHFDTSGTYLTYKGIYGWNRYYVTIPFTEQRQWDEVGSFRHIQTIDNEMVTI